jgi:hypothetical protein
LVFTGYQVEEGLESESIQILRWGEEQGKVLVIKDRGGKIERPEVKVTNEKVLGVWREGGASLNQVRGGDKSSGGV